MATIMQVLPSLISGGVEVGTLEISRALIANGYGSLVVSSGGGMVSKLQEEGGKHIQLNVKSKNPFQIFYNNRQIANLAEEYKVDLLHARSRAPAWSCYLAARKRNIRFVTTVHGVYSKESVFKKFYNEIMLKGDKVIAVSNFVKNHILENYNISDESKIIVIPRGVDHIYYDPAKITNEKIKNFRQKYRVPQDSIVIALPARFSDWKGQKLLIEAIKKLKHLNIYCILVGDLSKHPAYVSRVKDMIEKLKLQGKIQIFSTEIDMFGLYSIADIIISASTEPEAFGRTIIEAQSMQKFVVASNIGGASETILDQVNGIHFKNGDANDLAEKISYAIELFNSSKYHDLCASARSSVINLYSLQKMQNDTLKVYKELL